MKEQVAELRDKLRMSNFHHQEEIAELQAKVDNLSKAILAQEEKHKADVSQVKAGHQKQIGELEVEVKKQRERTVVLLAEKDAEIQRLRSLSGHSFEPDSLRQWGQLKDSTAQRASSDISEEQEAVSRLLDMSKNFQNEAAFLHFAQEKGRMEVEINGLRKQKRALETALRDLQVSVSQKEEKLRDEISALNEQLLEVHRHANREGANVEYLKNVMVKFLTSTDVHCKTQMLKAVMTVLQFSPAERDAVHQSQAKGWWPA